MVELATAYVSVVASTDRIPGQIKSALGQGDVHAAAAGKSMGGKMSSALGMALKAGVAGAAAAGVATLGVAMAKGFQRLDAIDQAKAKLGALGNSAKDVDSIMQNALASVKGTAFGLGDAAGLAGTMVAAGIKPGKELESVLKTVADTAAVAGTDLGEMGSIFGKAAAQGKVDGEVMAQLMDRQIGLLPALAKHYKVTTEEAKKMVSDGKVSFKDFTTVMQDMVGGGAVKMGQTVKGAFQNMNAALGRIGASALEPFFNRAGGGLGNITSLLDKIEPKVKAFSQALSDKVFDEWGPKLQAALQSARDSGQLDKLMSTLKGMAQAGIDIAPALEGIGKALASAAGAIGIGTWQLFLTALEAGAGFLNIINPLLTTAAGLMENNRGAVIGLVTAWTMFKTVPSLIGRVNDMIAPMTARVGSARVAATEFGSAYQTSLGYIRQANPGISTAGAHLGVLRGNLAAAGGAGGLLKSGLGGVVGALGGPVGIGLTATLGVGMFALSKYQESQQKAAEEAQKHKQRTDELTASIKDYSGALDENGKVQIAKNLQEDGKLDQLRANQGRGLEVTTEQYVGAAQGDQGMLDHVNAQLDKQVVKSIEAQSQWSIYKERLDDAGISQETFVAALRGNNDAIQEFKDKHAPIDLEQYKKRLNETGREAIELGEAIGHSNDEIDGAAKKAKQMDQALGLAGKQMADVASKMKGLSVGEKITVDTQDIRAAREGLESLGLKLVDLPNGKTEVVATTEDALRKLEFVKGNVNLLNLLKANPKIGMDTAIFEAKDAETQAKLASLKNTTADPKVTAVIDDLLAGHKVSMERLAELDSTTAKPLVDLLAEKAKQDADDVKNRIDGIKDKDVTIRVHTQAEQTEYGQAVIAALQQSAQDQGFSSGGWTGPGSKYQPAGIVHADEFVIRKESRKKIEAAHPGALDSMNATGQMPGYADGGRVASAADLKRMIQPLAGRSYGWGAWPTWDTDCSGAQSIGRNLALTGDAFGGGRFATGNEQESLLASGYQLGRAPAGVPAVEHGWINGGPGGGHTAGTIIDPQGGDLNFEMGGAGGNGQVGGTAAGSRDGQFSHIAWHPLSGGAPKSDLSQSDQGAYLGDQGYQSEQSGDYSTSSAEQPKGASLSERLGNAASAFVSGQVQSLLGVLSVNDSPGVLAAINEYESQRSQAKQQSPTVDQTTTKPQEGEDTGASAKSPDTPAAPAALTGVEAIKAAFKQGLREAWRTGVEWDASDWIVGKESNWDPKARNPSSGAFGLGQWLGSTKDQYLPDENPDPTVQGKAFDAYVNDRYELPTKAKAHWDQEGWYDVGGVIHEGTTLVKNGLGHKETALPFDPHDLKKSLDRSSDDRVLERLDRLIALTERMNERIGEGGDTFNWTSSGNSKQDMDEVQRARHVAKLAGV